MATIVRNRVRIAVDAVLSRGVALTDVLTSRALEWWQAEDVQTEIGIFSNGTIAADLTNCASVTMEVKDPFNLLGAPLISKTVLAAAMDLVVSLSDWNAGVDAHAIFVLTNAETNIELEGNATRLLTLFFWMTTTDVPARRIPLGSSLLTLRDSGYGDLGAIAIQAPGARMSGSKLQVLNQDDTLYYDLVLRNVSGVPVLSVEGAGVP